MIFLVFPMCGLRSVQNNTFARGDLNRPFKSGYDGRTKAAAGDSFRRENKTALLGRKR